MSQNLPKRYPGSLPFARADAAVFCGRDADAAKLHRRVSLHAITVLHGKSGLGKTSLLNAAIVPRLEDEGCFCLKIRFYADSPDPEKSNTPRRIFKGLVAGALESPDAVFLPEVENEPWSVSLWQQFKALEWQHRTARRGILLVFDQFEELFTYPHEAVEEFAREFSDLLDNRPPAFFQQKLQLRSLEQPDFLQRHAPEVDFLERRLHLRTVFSIRSDRMSHLDRLSPWMPDILKNCFELLPLDREQARQAIEWPASAPGAFATPIFSFAPEAVGHMLDFLSESGAQPVESFQLQVICQKIEERIEKGAHSETEPLGVADLGDLENILRDFYDEALHKFPPGERPAIQRCIEEGLILEKEDRRLSLYAGQIVRDFGVPETALARLVDLRLLRSEPAPGGGFLYELCHDSMVAPVKRIMAARRETERLAAEAAEREKLAAEAAAERRARRRAFWVAAGAILLALVALAACIFAYIKYVEAEHQRKVAVDATEFAKGETHRADSLRQKAEAALELAVQKTRDAENSARDAREQTDRAKRAEAVADSNFQEKKLALDSLRNSQNATAEALEQAEKNYEDAQKERERAQAALDNLQTASDKIVKTLLDEAAEHVRKLEFAKAAEKLAAAAPIGQGNPTLADRLVEIAFVYAETDDLPAAAENLRLARQTAGLPALVPAPETREAILQALKSTAPSWFGVLEGRYFPSIATLPGGTFRMGCTAADGPCPNDETPARDVSLAPFGIAETETTVWQFGLYCLAIRRNPTDFAPVWGLQGNLPAVNVSWLEAARYANWLSRRAGLDTVYVFSNDGQTLAAVRPAATGFRLPTEAQWEFSARGGGQDPAGATMPYSGSAVLDSVGWYAANTQAKGNNRPSITKAKPANAAGLYDLSGNVREWCHDLYGPYPALPQTDPTGPPTGENRVLRGGAYNYLENFCTVQVRQYKFAGGRDAETGFRVAASLVSNKGGGQR